MLPHPFPDDILWTASMSSTDELCQTLSRQQLAHTRLDFVQKAGDIVKSEQGVHPLARFLNVLQLQQLC